MKFAARKVLLAKMKLPDHAQLLVKFLSKKIFKNFENFRKYFYFFRMENFWDFRNFDFRFSIWFSMKKYIFRNFRNFRNFRKFSKFSKFLIFKISEIFGNVAAFFIFWDEFFMDFKKIWCSGKLKVSSFRKVPCLFMKYASLGLIYVYAWKSRQKQVPGCFISNKTS